MNRITALNAFFALALTASCAAPGGANSAPLKKKVLILGIDGCRAELLDVAKTPNLHRLMDDGAWTLDAKTGPITVSGPGWSSLLTGVWMEKHGVRDNKFEGNHLAEFPHFFAHLKEKRPDAITASIVDWLPIDQFIVGATGADVRFTHDYQDHGDELSVKAAIETLATKNPDAMFVYFADLDETGHNFGFHEAVPQYRAKLEEIDGQIGEILGALKARASYASEDWLILVSADHGGTVDGSHGRDIVEHRSIPFIASGPSAARGKLWASINQVDVAATALAHLGVALDPAWKLDGHAVGLKHATPLGANLIFNGDAESSTGFSDASTNVEVAGWTDVGPMTVILYGSPNGFPSASSKGSPTRGSNFFCGGKASESSMFQLIDVAELATAIDAGSIDFELSGWFGGFNEQKDLAWLDASFLDERGGEIERVRIGEVSLEDRQREIGGAGDELTGFLRRAKSGVLPKSTRHVRITLHAEAASGDNDGYADDLSLVLSKAR